MEYDSPKPVKKHTGLFKLNLRDLVRGGITAGITATVSGLTDVLRKGGLPTKQDLFIHASYGILAFIGYIGLNLMTNTDGKLLKKDK